jgi:hypothetical protein
VGNPTTNFLGFTGSTFQLSDNLDVFGTLTANSKNFLQNHPYDPSLEIVYTTLEGPEAATYTRGSARLDRGTARIPLESSFAWVTQPGLGLTVSLTPRGRWANLYVVSVTTTELVVAATPESDQNVAFDYFVMGLRVGYEESPVLRPKTRDASLPEPQTLRAAIAGRPELAAHTPLARFRETEATVFGRSDVNLSAGDALRNAVGTHPNVARVARPSVEEPEASPQGARRQTSQAPSRSATDEARAPQHAGAVVAAADEPAEPARPRFGGLDTLAPGIGTIEPGDVLAVDPSGAGVRRADLAHDNTVVGIATGSPFADRDGTTVVPFAVAGIVTCHADATGGAIQPGDLLVSSPNPGFAMRSESPAPGAVLGKALEALPGGTGTIRMLVVVR